MIIKWDYFIDEETEAHKNASSSLFCEIDPKYMRATHWDALRGWPIFMRCRFLSSFISSYPFFSLLLSSQSLSLPGSSLSFVHFSDLPAASLGISSSNNDVQTQISKTSFLNLWHGSDMRQGILFPVTSRKYPSDYLKIPTLRQWEGLTLIPSS